MKKTIVALACLIVLCASIGNGLWILEVRPALADSTAIPTTAQPQIEIIGLVNSSDPQYLWPTDLQTAYNLPTTGGSGTIAIIDAYDDPWIRDDLHRFCSVAGLDYNDSRFEIQKMDSPTPADGPACGEISLDVEMAYALAPKAKILLVEATSDVFPDMLSAIDYAGNRSDVVAVSMSWGWKEQDGPFSYTWTNGTHVAIPFANETLYDSNFTSPYHAAFFSGSGDHGENVSWPACSPNVVGVGGTTLNYYSNGSFASETVWNDGQGSMTGGGVSAYETEPSYQALYGVQGSNGNRSVPDVSFDAGTPVVIFANTTTRDGQWVDGEWAVTGTSIGAPCWAAIYSLRPTASNPTLYAIAKSVYNSTCLRDITNGTNGNYNATAGYDFCTGLGSPLTGAFNSSLLGDLNFDDTVDIYDGILLEGAFYSVRGNGNWNALADINNDGTVDIYDAIILAGHFGKNYTAGSDSGMSGTSGTLATQSDGTSVTVDPNQTTVFKGEVFTVNVDITSVTDLRGWEFQLYWNSTVLNCTNVAIQTPSEWQNNTQNFGPGLQENYSATTALYWQAQAATYPASSFNGSMTIVTLTFQALQPGTTSLTLADVKLGNSTGEPIACSVSSGSVSVYYGRYMRSDTETVNGLGAYVLNIPESTSSASVTQSGDGHGASWGIRAFVRHSNGVEQEISLDGQTGTPKAVVYRTGGSGVQSNTVAVAQTALQHTDSLVVRVYAKVGTSDWVASATFTTEQLQASTLKATTWTLYYYTYAYYYRTYNFTASTFYWGTTTYNSQIQNLQYT